MVLLKEKKNEITKINPSRGGRCDRKSLTAENSVVRREPILTSLLLLDLYWPALMQ